MRSRRLQVIGLSFLVLVPLAACGNDGPDMGSATLPGEEAAGATEDSTFDEGAAAAQLIGTTAGDLAPSTTTTTTTEPTSTPTTGAADEPTMSAAAEAAEIADVCGEVFDYIVRVQSADPTQLSPEAAAALADITVDLMSRIAELQGEVTQAGYDRLEECRTGLEQNTI